MEFVPNGQNAISQYYEAKPDVAAADAVDVKAGASVSAVDATLGAGGSITGVVTDPAGQPLADIEVDATTADCTSAGGQAYTDASGNYTIAGLPTGTYKVVFNPQAGQDAAVVYPTRVDVTAAQTTDGIGTVLPPGNTTTAASIDCNQAPLPPADVAPMQSSAPQGNWVGAYGTQGYDLAAWNSSK